MTNIIIEGTGAYIPTNKVYNEELEEQLQSRGLSAKSLMKHLGRRKRYFKSACDRRKCMYSDKRKNQMRQ